MSPYPRANEEPVPAFCVCRVRSGVGVEEVLGEFWRVAASVSLPPLLCSGRFHPDRAENTNSSELRCRVLLADGARDLRLERVILSRVVL